jgi:alkylation response protein AidB-like acyl-CoA dehydrogenase
MTATTATAQAATPVTPVARPTKTEIRPPKALPAPNSDFYQLADVLTAEEKAVVNKVRAYMETKVQPIINKYWSDDAFPFELLPSFKELQLGGLGYQGYGCAGGSQKLFGFVAMELARVDACRRVVAARFSRGCCASVFGLVRNATSLDRAM